MKELEMQLPKWISVEDVLPEEKQHILMVDDCGGKYSGRGSVLIATNDSDEPSFGTRMRYTHWMPFPQPPTGEREMRMPKPNDTNHFLGIGNMVFDPDAALTLAERTLDVEITEPLADDIVKFSRKLYEIYTQADHFADVDKMIEVKVPSDDAIGVLKLALEYWADRQQRYRNRAPVWVQEARALLAHYGAAQPSQLSRIP